MIAYRKGITVDSISDLLSPKISNIFMPDDTKAIYGIAGTVKGFETNTEATKKSQHFINNSILAHIENVLFTQLLRLK